MKNQEMTDANKRLAGLLGWTNVIEVSGALVGTPPAGAPECRGQAAVPDWAGDWSAIGPLIAVYHIDLEWTHDGSSALAIVNLSEMHQKFAERLVDHASQDDALRLALARAAIAALELGQ